MFRSEGLVVVFKEIIFIGFVEFSNPFFKEFSEKNLCFTLNTHDDLQNDVFLTFDLVQA